ncbi:hypothetical protein LshimejAT787_0700310 [Lyophyllum shimeji]|uniref:Zinc transporter 6 n=1 Tax=Lyophyllum shimeji TaxID=47721 RepID=A0A9P3UQS1_LYOSH|nr:hypothetical protein LshimejAT787_0700310 [Lyophyllum shimeji]
MDGHYLHRRKSSKDEDENIVLIARPMELEPAPDEVPVLSPPPPPRNRVRSTPIHQHSRSISSVGMGGGGAPPSAGPFRTGFNLQPTPSSPYGSSFAPHHPGHSRTRSISAFTPSVHSPLASSFPPPSSISSPTIYTFPPGPPSMNTSHSAPDASQTQPPPKPSSRRHSRLHSRNLSIFFPRPGSLPQNTIAEDGAQELEVRVDEEAPISTIPSAGPSISLPSHSRRAHAPPTPLGAGFTFGGRPPSSPSSAVAINGHGEGAVPEPITRSSSTSSTRRGHHHKHSMSHSFFSFLEPGANASVPVKPEDLHTLPTPTPVSPWAPISAFPQSAQSTTARFPPHTPATAHANGVDNAESGEEDGAARRHQPGVVAAGLLQFVLGAWLWVSGQQIGSLSVTGLGYWVVFDAFGVALGGFLPQWLDLKEGKEDLERRRIRRPYGNGPVQTVMMFAQAVYLMFSSVYVCKETVEHVLLSAGGGEGHHHHRGDEDESLVGIEFPVALAFITLISVLGTALLYDNHAKLLSVTGNRIPSLRSLVRSLSSSTSSRSKVNDPPPTLALGIVLSNPYVASPLVFAVGILGVAMSVPAEHQRTADLLLAALITVATFSLAYGACKVLGTVLLQTAPPRGAAGGRMEAFLRAMREVERHPQVLHLPAPHIWQLTPAPAADSVSPSSSSSSSYSHTANGNATAKSRGLGLGESLVVTLELHVRHDLGDEDVLGLTRWAWEKCAAALGGGGGGGGGGRGGGAKVTVGVVRG